MSSLRACHRACLMMLLAGVCGSVSVAQDKRPVSLRLEPYCTSPRSYSPILVSATLDPYVPQLLEGTLHLRFEDLGLKLLEVRIPDIVLSGAAYTTTLVLPPMPTPVNKVIDVYARFVTADREYGLGAPTGNAGEESYLSLLVSPSNQRDLTTAMVCEGSLMGPGSSLSFLGSALALETYTDQPDLSASGGNPWGRFSCTAPVVAPDLLPADPLALCAFDVVTLSNGGFGRMTEKQLVALKSWVQAGGSLCVIPDGNLTQRHANFLTELLDGHPDEPAIVVDKNGELVADGDWRLLQKVGLGRVVVLATDRRLQTAFSESDWRLATGFLWKVHADLLSQPRWGTSSRRSRLPDSRPVWERQSLRQQGFPFEPATNVMLNSSELVNDLMPRNVRMVPLSLVAGVLVAYVLIVGPGDYLLLGLLKLRRFTWIVFPVVTILFTVGMVSISNYYMSTSETGGLVEVSDVVEGNVVARRTRLDLEFFSSRRVLETDRTGQFFVPMDVRTSLYDYQNSVNNYGQVPRRQLNQPAEFSGDTMQLHYEGRVPGRFTTHRIVRQWEPQLTRTFEILSEAAPNFGFDWDNPGPLHTHSGRRALGAAVASSQPRFAVEVFNRGERYPLRWLTGERSASTQKGGVRYGSRDAFGFVTEASSRTTNFFSYVSQIGPNGAGNFEDLAILDVSDASQWLLVVASYEDDTLHVFRRVYDEQELRQRPAANSEQTEQRGHAGDQR